MSFWFKRFGFATVHPGLIVGAYPVDGEDVAEIAAAEATRIHNLCEDAEYGDGERAAVEAALEQAGIGESRLPLEDYGGLAPEALERSIEEIGAALDDGEVVYLHCRAGWQRSAAVAAGVISVREGLEVDDALGRLRMRKPTAEPLPHQREDLLAWQAQRG